MAMIILLTFLAFSISFPLLKQVPNWDIIERPTVARDMSYAPIIRYCIFPATSIQAVRSSRFRFVSKLDPSSHATAVAQRPLPGSGLKYSRSAADWYIIVWLRSRTASPKP